MSATKKPAAASGTEDDSADVHVMEAQRVISVMSVEMDRNLTMRNKNPSRKTAAPQPGGASCQLPNGAAFVDVFWRGRQAAPAVRTMIRFEDLPQGWVIAN